MSGAAVKAARDNEGRTPHEICKIIADLPEFGGNYAEAEKFYNSMIRNLETSTWMERMRAELCGLFVGFNFEYCWTVIARKESEMTWITIDFTVRSSTSS